jgi:hypothetical protein
LIVKNFILESKINLTKIESWADELNKLRNCINSSDVDELFGYFKFSSFLGVCANELHFSGVAFNILTAE